MNNQLKMKILKKRLDLAPKLRDNTTSNGGAQKDEMVSRFGMAFCSARSRCRVANSN